MSILVLGVRCYDVFELVQKELSMVLPREVQRKRKVCSDAISSAGCNIESARVGLESYRVDLPVDMSFGAFVVRSCFSVFEDFGLEEFVVSEFGSFA